MKLFLDIGAFNGALSLRAAESGHYDRVYAFEPNPDCICPTHPMIVPIPLLAWNCTNLVLCKFGTNGEVPTQGGSPFADKVTGNLTHDREVVATDLALFVRRNGHESIDLHLDCEGSEYVLLPHLVAAGAIDRITRLSVEWHADKIPSISAATDRAVRAMVAALDKPECLVREE